MGEFRMPALGADTEQGSVVEWLVKPGDCVHRGDMVAVVDTEKADIDVESFEEGVVAELLVEVGTTVLVGAPLARITQTPAAEVEPTVPTTSAPAPALARAVPVPGFVSPPMRQLAHRLGIDTDALHGTGKHGALTRADVEQAAAALSTAEQPPARHRPPAEQPSAPAVTPLTVRRVRSSPLVRRVAKSLGVDLAVVPGTGAGGAVTEADVRNVTTAPPVAEPAAAPVIAPTAGPTAAPTDAAERAAGLLRAIGSLMARSKKTIPHYYLSTTRDLRAALAWMEQYNSARPIAERLVPAALLPKASALAARDVPEVNGFFTEGSFQPSAAVHLSVAVAVRRGGLVAPAPHDADTLPLEVLMKQLRDLVSRARGGRFLARIDELLQNPEEL
ncbi:2-oxo acid dehydrogenase subunit E2 [Cryobacterium sp. TMT1-62]|uniref:E3 binding domain-containing protein n=1 Tax=Cryobacterium sp. TMT1-62 TaxID=1259240 RepID=UPI00106C1E45|nr:E3 binding domain-containing protein [Cryobacterium sp. TMT1-62]TFD32443.1 2-oxo acid dehydrogenase subunit E2 [Cryobacterium sp. TMT1-62]